MHDLHAHQYIYLREKLRFRQLILIFMFECYLLLLAYPSHRFCMALFISQKYQLNNQIFLINIQQPQQQTISPINPMSQHFLRQIKQQYHQYIPQIKYRTNFTNCIYDTFQKKGYIKVEDDDWDIIWSQKDYINQIYEKRLLTTQRINHFRNFYQLCRKDNLIRNLKKYRKNLERDGKNMEAQAYNFYPLTYVLPSEYVIFADQFKRHQAQDQKKNVWIMKPIGKSQGKGIFLFNKLSQISQWQNHSAQNYIVQKYISDPLLIGGKKFDMRIYVLVTNYSPLTVYLYRSGFARFTHVRYDQTKITQSQIHLTNVAIQKNSDAYDQNLGGKWFLDKLKNYLTTKYGQDKVNAAFYRVQELIIKTLEALQKVMTTERNNSFELYGFDVLFDSKLDPWLIEVNGSPSMTANTPADYQLKVGLLQDTLLVVDMEKFLTGNEDQIGGFDLICKGKPNKNHEAYTQKISFLGTYNNREQNLKKIAKNAGTRLNNQFSCRLQNQSRKLATTTNTHQIVNSSQASKRSILLNNIKKQSKAPSQNHQNQVLGHVGRDFVIKHKIRKQTNENQMR